MGLKQESRRLPIAIMERLCCTQTSQSILKRFLFYFDSFLTFFILQFDLKPADISSNNLEFAISADLIIVTILPNAEAPELEYFSFEKSLAKSDNFTTDHSVRAFFELLTSEYPISRYTLKEFFLITNFFSGEFQHLQAGAIFQTKPLLRQPNKVKIGMSAFDGMQKGIRIVDKSTALMVLDCKFLKK